MSRAAAFLDRDGTLNVRPPEHHYVRSLREFIWLPGAQEAVTLLREAGYQVYVVSNQRGVARGLVSEELLLEIEEHIQRQLERHGAHIDAFRYCTHDLAAQCSCRKPRPGLVLELAREFDVDVARSWLIGDSETDVVAGRAAGCRTALITRSPDPSGADIRARSLLDVARRITELGAVAA